MQEPGRVSPPLSLSSAFPPSPRSPHTLPRTLQVLQALKQNATKCEFCRELALHSPSPYGFLQTLDPYQELHLSLACPGPPSTCKQGPHLRQSHYKHRMLCILKLKAHQFFCHLGGGLSQCLGASFYKHLNVLTTPSPCLTQPPS